MLDYQKMYYLLFNALTDALEHLYRREWGAAAVCLERAQQRAEEVYLSGGGEAPSQEDSSG